VLQIRPAPKANTDEEESKETEPVSKRTTGSMFQIRPAPRADADEDEDEDDDSETEDEDTETLER
jgi:hypothetical protein